MKQNGAIFYLTTINNIKEKKELQYEFLFEFSQNEKKYKNRT